MNGLKEIEYLIDKVIIKSEKWFQKGGDGLIRLIDPIDGIEISAHYGATHSAAAFIIYGKLTNNNNLLEKGRLLLRSIINRWEISKKLPGYHFDFNNFALCVAYNHLNDTDKVLKEEIKINILKTPDSNHNTINWLPMRWYVNKKRYEWSGKIKYKEICNKCSSLISQAINNDGSIEDQLPKGVSFNLQYDIATVAVLQFLKSRGEEDISLSKELGFLLNSVAPDGDINYLGRGVNQIFAWGLWIYLLSSKGKTKELGTAISFLRDKVFVMLNKDNLMLNIWDGKEKYLWWDYHYSSVYISHFLFWLVLATVDFNKYPETIVSNESKDSVLKIYKDADHFISVFEGRSKYLAERGPVISSFWMRKYGMINKGSFGPWIESFGEKHTFWDVVLRNYFGLLEVNKKKDWKENRIVHKVLPRLKIGNHFFLYPVFDEIKIYKEKSTLNIIFNNTDKNNVMLNFPVFSNFPEISLLVDGEPMSVYNNIKIRNQYGWCNIYQSRISNSKEWIVQLK